MKKINIIIAVVTLALFGVACETYDDYNTDRKTVVRFHQVVPREGNTEDHKITVIPGGSDLRLVEVFTSDESDVDRTFNVILVDSLTTVASENYSFNSTITVPAHERRALLTFNVTDVSLTDDYEDVAIAIEGVTGSIVAGVPFVLELRWRIPNP